MTDQSISALPVQANNDITNLFLAGIDLTKPAGARNRKISAQGMLAAYFAAYGSSGGSGGEYSQHTLGVTVAIGGYTDVALYTPVVPTNDVALVSLQFGQASIVPQAYHFQIFAGVPSGTGVLVYDSYVATGATIKTASAFMASTLYIAAAAGNTNLYVRIFNTGTILLTISFQGVFLEFPGNGVVLPAYTPPPPYLGPLQSTVHVGPNEAFIEPQYGLQALADGGTMYIDDGHYFLVMGVLNTADSNLQTPNFGGTSANPANRFNHVTIIGNSTYGCVWDGLGGIGTGNRLAEGKGILLLHCPALVKTINFISGGGADTADFGGGGEAGVYAENFLSAGTLTVQNCGFDNCGDGVFVPDVDGKNGSNWVENGGPGVNVTLALQACDFGYNAPNGINADGGAHNFYVSCPSNVVTGCHLYTCGAGNTMKNRGPSLAVTGSYIEGGAGRALDQPEGGSVSISSSTLTVINGANAPFLGYNSESTTRPWRVQSNPSIDSCTVIGSRNPYSQIWYNNSSGNWAFTNTTQEWFGPEPGFIPERVQSGYMSDTTAVTGLFLTPSQGGTVLSAAPVRPGSIAQPGYPVTPFVAWNGTV